MKQEIKNLAIYTTEEVAALLGLSQVTIQRYIRNKKINASIIGGKWYRIKGQDIIDFINTFQTKNSEN